MGLSVHKIFAAAFASLILFAVVGLPADAASKLVAQQTTTKTGGIYLTARLIAGHHYRIDVSAPKRVAFSGMGGENYTYVSNQHLFTATKPFQLKGTTPKSFTVSQKVKGKVTGWILFMDVAMTRGKSVTVRVYDTGA